MEHALGKTRVVDSARSHGTAAGVVPRNMPNGDPLPRLKGARTIGVLCHASRHQAGRPIYPRPYTPIAVGMAITHVASAVTRKSKDVPLSGKYPVG